jgi:drug/metabolite transporter (DMT)-like permease
VLVAGARGAAGWSPFGVIAIAGAMLAWGLDNTWTRGLSSQDAVRVVAAKAGLGALATALVALASRDVWPSPIAALQLIACGATGYGLSLRLYLIAQRRIGAARTASIFALAPFVGAAASWGLGGRADAVTTLAAGALFALGVYLHVTEHHHHVHRHAPVRHEHAHRHDDGHHAHAHEPAVVGEHSHPHTHDAVEHDHDHAPDVHHDHEHA